MSSTKKIYTAVAVIVILIVGAILNPLVTVSAGERGVVLNWGAFNGEIMEPGLHWRTPFVQRVVKMDVQTQKLEVEKSESYSKDLQIVDIHSVINYNIDPKNAGAIYQQYGLEFESRILSPNLEAAVKKTIAKYSAEELLNQRGQVQDEIQTAFQSSIPTGFVVTKYALVNEQFSAAYEAAIEKKQIAQQEAERAGNELKKAKIDAESRIAQAEGEARAIKIQVEAITQQGGQAYVDLKSVEKWDGKLPTQMFSGTALPFINLTK